MTSISLRAPRPELSSLKLLDLTRAIHTCRCLQCECVSPNRWGLTRTGLPRDSALLHASAPSTRLLCCPVHLHLRSFLPTPWTLSWPAFMGQPTCYCSTTPPSPLSMGLYFSRDAQFDIFCSTSSSITHLVCSAAATAPFRQNSFSRRLDLDLFKGCTIHRHNIVLECSGALGTLIRTLDNSRRPSTLYWCSVF